MPWWTSAPVAVDQTPAPQVRAGFTAGAIVNGHRALMPDGAGGVVHADPSTPGYEFAGVSNGAAPQGGDVSITTSGPMVEPSWSWQDGAALYIGPAGTLTATPPATGVLHQVGVAVSATEIVVQPSAPIHLA